MLQWCFFHEQYSSSPTSRWLATACPYSGTPEQFTDRLPAKMKGGCVALDAMERHLEGRDFPVGAGYSIADISLYAYTPRPHEGDFRPRAVSRDSSMAGSCRGTEGHLVIDA